MPTTTLKPLVSDKTEVRRLSEAGGVVVNALDPATFRGEAVAGTELAVYDGSLSEWTVDPSLPVEVG